MIREFLQKMLVLGLDRKKIFNASAAVFMREALIEEETCVLAEEFLTEIFCEVFLINIKIGKLFTFKISGCGKFKLKIKSTVFITAYCCAVSNGAVSAEIKNDEIVLKFCSTEGCNGLIRSLSSLGASAMRCVATGKLLVRIPAELSEDPPEELCEGVFSYDTAAVYHLYRK